MKCTYSGVHTGTFIEIRQGWRFVFCVRTQWNTVSFQVVSLYWNFKLKSLFIMKIMHDPNTPHMTPVTLNIRSHTPCASIHYLSETTNAQYLMFHQIWTWGLASIVPIHKNGYVSVCDLLTLCNLSHIDQNLTSASDFLWLYPGQVSLNLNEKSWGNQSHKDCDRQADGQTDR